MKKTRQSNLKINTNPEFDLIKYKDIKTESCKTESSVNKFKNINYLSSPSSGILTRLSKNKLTPTGTKANETRFSLVEEPRVKTEYQKESKNEIN